MSKGLCCDFVAFLLSKLCGSREIHIIILVFGFSRPLGVGPYGFPKKGLKIEGTWPENSKDIVYILSFKFGFPGDKSLYDKAAPFFDVMGKVSRFHLFLKPFKWSALHFNDLPL
jgi:hypothetical protein